MTSLGANTTTFAKNRRPWRRLLLAGLCLFMATIAGAIAGAGNSGARTQVREVDAKLVQAAQRGDVTQTKAAIAEGANVNFVGTNGLTPLLAILHGTTNALSADQRQCMALLIEHGAGNAGMDADGRTALICAARLGDLETVRLLIEAGALAKARDSFHKTALMYAVDARRRDIVVYLASNGDLQSPPYQARKTEGR